MTHVSEEFALSRVGGLCGIISLPQLMLVTLALADVSGYAENFHKAAVGTENRACRDIGPDGGAVFAPLFKFSPEVFQGKSSLYVGTQFFEICLGNGQ